MEPYIFELADTLEMILFTDSLPWLYIGIILVAFENSTNIGTWP